MLLAFFAAELPDIWNREAWPELSDNIDAVTASGRAFTKTAAMGDILGVYDTANPQTTTTFGEVEFIDAGDSVRVMTDLTGLFVEYQDPAPDLLAVEDDDLDDYELPARFKLPLAFRGAAHLIEQEDPVLAAKYNGMAEVEMLRQAARITRPFWRRPKRVA